MSANYEKALQKYFLELLKILPMNDAMFLASLYSHGLLPGNLKNLIRLESTQADKASLFLDNMIEQTLTVGDDRLVVLLECMEEHESEELRGLAQKIKADIHASISPSTSAEVEILNTVPKMLDLIKIVIPNVEAYWDYVAYALQYRIQTVKIIRAGNRDDPNQCCQELFEDWLSTDNGAKPKVWSTLLDALKQIDTISPMMDDIIAKVNQLGPTHQDVKRHIPAQLTQFEEPDKVDKSPSMEELDQYIVPNYSLYWRALGILLDIQSAKHNIITRSCVNNEDCCRKILNEWLNTDHECSWRELLEAVQSLPVDELITTIPINNHKT